jgi:predicted RNase H-like HicB family nuclease
MSSHGGSRRDSFRRLPGPVPGLPGAHSQGATLDELAANLREVIELLFEEGEPELEGEFVGTQQIIIP